jgi:hypothetical protein
MRRRRAAGIDVNADQTAITRTNDRSGVSLWLAASIAIVLAIFGGLFSRRLILGSDTRFGAVAFVREHHLHGNVLSNFADGEYLIWHLPDSKVFIDGRYDTVYPEKIVHQYLEFINGRPEALTVLRAYRHNRVMLPRDSNAVEIMRQASEWRLIHRDKDWMLFARADSAAARMPGIPIESAPPTPSYFP